MNGLYRDNLFILLGTGATQDLDIIKKNAAKTVSVALMEDDYKNIFIREAV